MTVEIWDKAGIELAAPGSAVRLATNCATRPSSLIFAPTEERCPKKKPLLYITFFSLVGSYLEDSKL